MLDDKASVPNRITSDAILQYRDVPVEVAAEYIGKGKTFIYAGLQTGRLDFGSAVLCPGGTWSYHISPQKLVEYQEGRLVDLPVELAHELHKLAGVKGYASTRELIVCVMLQYLCNQEQYPKKGAS